MRITLLGTGTSLPDIERVQSGIFIDLGEEVILIDIGSGVLHRLTQTKIDLRRIQHIFITHTHVDHCSDIMTLCQTLWMLGYDKTLNIHIPTGGKQWLRTMFESAYPYLQSKISVQVIEMDYSYSTAIGTATVTAWKTQHGTTQTRSIRVDHANHSVVVSSDTAPDPNLLAMAKGTDVLIHECNWLDGPHPSGVHTSPSELADIVAVLQPNTVILTHMSPEVISAAEEVTRIVKSTTNTRVVIGHDLMQLILD